jgi:hypothetical protein
MNNEADADLKTFEFFAPEDLTEETPTSVEFPPIETEDNMEALVSAVSGIYTDDEGNFDLWSDRESASDAWGSDYIADRLGFGGMSGFGGSEWDLFSPEPEPFSLRCVDDEPCDGKFFDRIIILGFETENVICAPDFTLGNDKKSVALPAEFLLPAAIRFDVKSDSCESGCNLYVGFSVDGKTGWMKKIKVGKEKKSYDVSFTPGAIV